MMTQYDPEFLRTAPWMSFDFTPPPEAIHAPGMLSWDERIMLSWLTAEAYRGWGEIVELGTYLGSSSVSLAAGLAANQTVEDKHQRIHAFDRFQDEQLAQRIRQETDTQLPSDGNFLGAYKANIAAYRDYISINAGDLTAKEWNGKRIEILFVDVLKSRPLVDAVVRNFFPSLTPNRSLVIMQDYNWRELPFSAVLMEHFGEYFTRAGETMMNSVLFLNTKQLPPSMISDFSYDLLPTSLRLHYLMQALAKQPTFRGKECIAHQISDFLNKPGGQ
jgi:hypothetical protein